MIKYICDLCGKESGYSDKYYIPMMHSDGKFKSVYLHLCMIAVIELICSYMI